MRKFFFGLIILFFIVGCKKETEQHVSIKVTDASINETNPYDEDYYDNTGGGGNSNPNWYVGGSDCSSANYSVMHNNELKYTISFSLVNNDIENLNFSVSFKNVTPTITSYSLQYKNANYSLVSNTVSVTITYLKKTKIGLGGSDTYTSNEYITYSDQINLCDNGFVFQY